MEIRLASVVLTACHAARSPQSLAYCQAATVTRVSSTRLPSYRKTAHGMRADKSHIFNANFPTFIFVPHKMAIIEHLGVEVEVQVDGSIGAEHTDEEPEIVGDDYSQTTSQGPPTQLQGTAHPAFWYGPPSTRNWLQIQPKSLRLRTLRKQI
jgi:hypothetical protein